jgi:hypothetical protein
MLLALHGLVVIILSSTTESMIDDSAVNVYPPLVSKQIRFARRLAQRCPHAADRK